MIYEDLKDKKVLITGSSSGIGAETAIRFANQGAFVGVHYFRTEEGAKQSLEKVKKLSDGTLVQADLRNEEEVKEMVHEFAETAGGIDILVNNAGTLIERQSFEEGTAEYHRNIYDTNVLSMFLTTRFALEHLKKSEGSIINIGSLAGHTGGGGGSGIYAGAKAAVVTETIGMAKEFAKYGIRANSVLPGFIETRFHKKFSTPERVKEMPGKIPLGRNGKPEDIAKAILFLASKEAAGYITGEYIAVNGGINMRP